jgi:phage terminase large subunit-like protein
MCAFIVDFNRTEMTYSPDRADAFVWALTELMIEGKSEYRFFVCLAVTQCVR